MQHYKTKQNIVNSKTKQKSKTILGVIRNLVLDFILYFVTAYIKLYLKEKTNFFCLIKLRFIKIKCLINVFVSFEANLEGQGW